jgi:hypothetical protein
MNYRGILYDLQKRHNKYSLQCYDSPFFHILYAPFLGIGRICNANLWYFCSSHKDERRPVYATVDIWWIAPKGKNVSTTNTRFHPRSQLQHGILGFFFDCSPGVTPPLELHSIWPLRQAQPSTCYIDETITDWSSLKEGILNYFGIFRTPGSSLKTTRFFSF